MEAESEESMKTVRDWSRDEVQALWNTWDSLLRELYVECREIALEDLKEERGQAAGLAVEKVLRFQMKTGYLPGVSVDGDKHADPFEHALVRSSRGEMLGHQWHDSKLPGADGLPGLQAAVAVLVAMGWDLEKARAGAYEAALRSPGPPFGDLDLMDGELLTA